MLKREEWRTKNDWNMKTLLPGSIHVELKVREPEILDIETGEVIHLNGFNCAPSLDGLSITGDITIGDNIIENKNIHSYLDSEP
ncbi:MAG: hypothetical protein ACLFPH_09320 [Bacteroidales bacterium]